MLRERLGSEGVDALVSLWAYAAANKPDGRLAGMSVRQIAGAAMWKGDAETLIGALLDEEIRYIERDDCGVYVLHDWADHNPYAARAEERSMRAREKALKRWGRNGSDSAGGMLGVCTQHADSMQAASSSIQPACTGHADSITCACREQCAIFLRLNAPSPSPSPSPSPKENIVNISLFEEIWKNYPSKDGKKEALRHFKASVKNDQDAEDIKKALAKYKAHLAINTWKPPKNGSTWFNNWRDWVDWKEPEGPLDKEIEQAIEKIQAEIGELHRRVENKKPEDRKRDEGIIRHKSKVFDKLKSREWGKEQYASYISLDAQAFNLSAQYRYSQDEETKAKLDEVRRQIREMLA
jgi:hypothetical protein